MKAIWKFTLRFASGEQLCRTMPRDAIPIRFAMQGESPTLWVECDPKASQKDRYFAVVGTGHPVPEDWEYIGTCDQPPFVWHAFECHSSNGNPR